MPATQQQHEKYISQPENSTQGTTAERAKSRPSSAPSVQEDDRVKSGEEVYRSVPSAVPSKKRSTQDGTCPSESKRFAQSNYNGMWWTATNNQTGQAWNVPLTGYSQASIWPGVTTAVAWNEAASRYSQPSTWSWAPVAVNQVAYSQQPSAMNWAQHFPPIPGWIHHEDQRFHEKKNNGKEIRCDACGDWQSLSSGVTFDRAQSLSSLA